MTVCYEYLADILKNAPEDTLPSGITRQDAILGPFVDVFLHESGHAVFDLLKVPVLGREEDAADFFSAYIMLQLGKEEARRIILGSAYQYKADVLNPDVRIITKFADEHGLPARAFTMCGALHMVPTKNYSAMSWRRVTYQRNERRAATPNMRKPLSHSRR